MKKVVQCGIYFRVVSRPSISVRFTFFRCWWTFLPPFFHLYLLNAVWLIFMDIYRIYFLQKRLKLPDKIYNWHPFTNIQLAAKYSRWPSNQLPHCNISQSFAFIHKMSEHVSRYINIKETAWMSSSWLTHWSEHITSQWSGYPDRVATISCSSIRL